MMTAGLFMLVAVIGLSAVVPVAGAVVCSAILVLQIGILAVRSCATYWKKSELVSRSKPGKTIFSVHVATHNEPPQMVIGTLEALWKQDWPDEDYEIIVIDNNTADAALWKPVSEFCENHRGNFKFLHRSGVVGAKAGALNIALSYTRPDATHVVTVDADYVVIPQFLGSAAKALLRTGADYVQFPQSYAMSTENAAGVDAELEEYFRSTAQMADGAEAVLLTGTLCVISKSALVATGGWSGSTTTEDAEMGVRLCHAGFTGRFISQVVGKGLLPFSLTSLGQQRYRWCSGNLQTLIHHADAIFLRHGGLHLHKRLAVISQLTAWLNLSLVPGAILLFSLLVGQSNQMLLILAASAVLLSFGDVTLRIMERVVLDRLKPSVALSALASRLALAPLSARATVETLLGKQHSFIVTTKSVEKIVQNEVVPIHHLFLFFAALIALPLSLSAGAIVTAAVLIMLLPLPAAIFTERTLRNYRASIMHLVKGGRV